MQRFKSIISHTICNKNLFLRNFDGIPKASFSNIRDRIKKERLERLQQDSQNLPTKLLDDLSALRNFGIIAHIDAGKTTTTERMLFYAGTLFEPGEVHDGNTVMDYMKQERERGITIRAAAISFRWGNHQFNLIDTPGHIDFTGEVERALRVLDGAVAIFDGVHGVQTQSEMVWLQANKFNVPRIAFVNKMDRQGADLSNCVSSMKRRLNITPLIVQIPIGEADNFRGVIDIIHLKKIIWKDELGNEYDVSDLKPEDSHYKEAIKQREDLIETLGLFDEKLADEYLEGQTITNDRIEASLKQTIMKNPTHTCIVYVGSALKNKGIQPLMDGVIKYLPSPLEKEPVKTEDPELGITLLRRPDKKDKFCALAFKVINDAMKGKLVYARVYSGAAASRAQIYNVSRKIMEKPTNMFRVRADRYIQLTEAAAGDIVAIAGLKETGSGDTIIDGKDDEKILLSGVTMPQPVFTSSIEYEHQKDLPALQEVITEDKETGQILVSGLGELHLEVFKDRLDTEYGLKVKLGKMKVSYRETIKTGVQYDDFVKKLINGKPHYLWLNLQIEPLDETNDVDPNESPETSKRFYIKDNVLEFAFGMDDNFMRYYNEYKRRLRTVKTVKKKGMEEDEVEEVKKPTPEELFPEFKGLKFIKNPTKPVEVETIEDEFGEDTLYSMASLPFEFLYELENTIMDGLNSGGLIGFNMMKAKVTVLDGKWSLIRTNETTMRMLAAQMVRSMVKEGEPVLLEPVAEMNISTPSDLSSLLMNDIITNKRGRIIEIRPEEGRFGEDTSKRSNINAIVPIVETIGFSTYLRSISKGEASFLMNFKDYEIVPANRQRQIIENMDY